jgi:hypothetical protein
MTDRLTKTSIKTIVRLILCLQFRRRMIRKETLMKYARVSASEFNSCFQKALERLRMIFGIDLIEVCKNGSICSVGNGNQCSGWICFNMLETQRSGIESNLESEKSMGEIVAVLLIVAQPIAMSLEELQNYLNGLLPTDRIDSLIIEMTRNQYLVKVLSGSILYKWGPRAKCEFPQSVISPMLQELYPELSSQQAEEWASRIY